jgi:EAL domain-containing protein (putative c-di-GMP-specific phosphodiesterase class I)
LIRKSFPSGATIFFEGEPADCAYIIEQGRVEICANRQGRHILLATLGQGEIFGEMSVIDGGNRSASAQALDDTELLIIRRDQLQRRIEHAEPVVGLLVKTLITRFRASQNNLIRELPSGFAPGTRLVLPGDPADPTADDSAFQWLRREQDVERGINADEFEPFFQPIVHLDDYELAGFEALVRWRHPERGLIPPGEFIPLAEKSGLIHRIDLAVIDRACRLVQRARGVVPGGVFLSVNLSAHHFNDTTVVTDLQVILEHSGLPPERLKVEITESALIADPEHTFRVLSRIQDLGATIALDDFGTGYASLSYLDRFPIDVLKIDQSFVRALQSGGRTRDIVASVAHLAHKLRMDMVAEGIESADLIPPLRELGVQFGQGYHFSRPVPAAVMADMVHRVEALPL